MKKLVILLCVVSLLSLGASAQANFGSPFVFAGVPSGTCSPNQLAVNSTNGDLYACSAGSWVKATGTSLSDLTDSAGVSITSAVPLIVPVSASGSAPTISASGSPTFGVYFAATGMGLQAGGNGWIGVGNTAATSLQLPAAGVLGWSSSASLVSAGNQTFLRSPSAAKFTFGGADVNGVPVAQTLSVQNAITGSNLVGSQFSIAGPLGTGTALPAPVVVQGADASVASGATAQTEISRFVSADTKNLTSGAATTLLSIPLATLQTTGGMVFIHMEATDGTNQCTLDDVVTYDAENSASVFVVNTSKIGTGATACTATKSLTATYAVTSANPALLQVTPTLTGITATRFTAVYTVLHGGMTNPTL